MVEKCFLKTPTKIPRRADFCVWIDHKTALAEHFMDIVLVDDDEIVMQERDAFKKNVFIALRLLWSQGMSDKQSQLHAQY